MPNWSWLQFEIKRASASLGCKNQYFGSFSRFAICLKNPWSSWTMNILSFSILHGGGNIIKLYSPVANDWVWRGLIAVATAFLLAAPAETKKKYALQLNIRKPCVMHMQCVCVAAKFQRKACNNVDVKASSPSPFLSSSPPQSCFVLAELPWESPSSSFFAFFDPDCSFVRSFVGSYFFTTRHCCYAAMFVLISTRESIIDQKLLLEVQTTGVICTMRVESSLMFSFASSSRKAAPWESS